MNNKVISRKEVIRRSNLYRAVKSGQSVAKRPCGAEDAAREAEHVFKKDIEIWLAARDTGRGTIQRSGGESAARLPKQSRKE